MSVPRAWQALSADGDSDLVLAVDFFAPGRPEASFADLAVNLSTSHPVWLAAQPTEPSHPIRPEAYLEWWLADIVGTGRTVHALLGFCAGSIFAAELADRIAAHQGRRPLLVVFDPEPMHPFGIYMQFHKQVERYAGPLTPERIAAVRRDGQALLDGAPEEPVRLGEELVALHRELAGEVFRESGIDEHYGGEILDLFGALIAYMVAAAQIDTATSWAEATALTSSTPGSGAEQARATIGFDVDRYELLRDEKAAMAVAELLTAGTP